MKLTERETWLIDVASAEIVEAILETVRTNHRRPWFVIVRSEVYKLALKLKARRK